MLDLSLISVGIASDAPAVESSVLEAAVHQQRIVLMGERRMGKSSLVEHTLTRADRVLMAVDLRGLDSVEDCIDRLLLRPTKETRIRSSSPARGRGSLGVCAETGEGKRRAHPLTKADARISPPVHRAVPRIAAGPVLAACAD